MTGYTVNTGSTQKFSEGWDRIFSGGSAAKRGGTDAKATSQPKAAKKSPAKAKAKKTAGKTATGATVKSRRAARSSRTSGKR